MDREELREALRNRRNRLSIAAAELAAERERLLAKGYIGPLSAAIMRRGVLHIEGESFSSPWTRDMYLAELKNVGVSFCYLARDETGQAVGFCSFWRIVDELHINNLAVLPGYRRRGIASTLLMYVLKEGARLGAGSELL